MRKTTITLAAIAGLSASTAFAGGMAEPMMEPEVISEEAAASSGGYVLPLILLAILVGIASGSSDGGSELSAIAK